MLMKDNVFKVSNLKRTLKKQNKFLIRKHLFTITISLAKYFLLYKVLKNEL